MLRTHSPTCSEGQLITSEAREEITAFGSSYLCCICCKIQLPSSLLLLWCKFKSKCWGHRGHWVFCFWPWMLPRCIPAESAQEFEIFLSQTTRDYHDSSFTFTAACRDIIELTTLGSHLLGLLPSQLALLTTLELPVQNLITSQILAVHGNTIQ